MARKGENIYKRKDGRYEGRFIKGYNQNGKAVFGYIYGKHYKEVKKKLLIAKNEMQIKHTVPSVDLNLSEWFDMWFEQLHHIKQSTKTVYQSYANKHIKPQIGNICLKELTPKDIQSFVDQWNCQESCSLKNTQNSLSIIVQFADCNRCNSSSHIFGILSSSPQALVLNLTIFRKCVYFFVSDCNRHYATLAVGCFSYHSRYFTGDNPSGLAVLIRSLL